MTTARTLLAEVDLLLGDGPTQLVLGTPAAALKSRPTYGVGRWPRAAALLTRQALESALTVYWTKQAPGVEQASTRAQMLCLGRYLGDEPLARRAHVAWSSLSRACHHHVYDLAPTREELQAWRDVVVEVVERTERALRL